MEVKTEAFLIPVPKIRCFLFCDARTKYPIDFSARFAFCGGADKIGESFGEELEVAAATRKS